MWWLLWCVYVWRVLQTNACSTTRHLLTGSLFPFLSRSSLTRDAGIYGIITAIIINGKIESPDEDGACKYSVFTGYAHLAAGLCVGLASMRAAFRWA